MNKYSARCNILVQKIWHYDITDKSIYLLLDRLKSNTIILVNAREFFTAICNSSWLSSNKIRGNFESTDVHNSESFVSRSTRINYDFIKGKYFAVECYASVLD